MGRCPRLRRLARVLGMTWAAWTLAGAATAALIGLEYGWFEAGWLRTRVLEVEIEGLPAELEGLRIGRLWDFHLGMIGRSHIGSQRAVAWVVEWVRLSRDSHAHESRTGM